MFDIFDGREEVVKYIKTFQEELIAGDNFLNKVDLYASKYDTLDQINSLLPFHPVKKGMKDTFPVSNKDYESYAAIIVQQDEIFKFVILYIVL